MVQIGGEFVNKNWQGAGAKMMGAMLDPLFGSTGLKKFFHRIGLATSEQTGLVADPTGLFPGLKEVPALTRMIEKYNSDVTDHKPVVRVGGGVTLSIQPLRMKWQLLTSPQRISKTQQS